MTPKLITCVLGAIAFATAHNAFAQILPQPSPSTEGDGGIAILCSAATPCRVDTESITVDSGTISVSRKDTPPLTLGLLPVGDEPTSFRSHKHNAGSFAVGTRQGRIFINEGSRPEASTMIFGPIPGTPILALDYDGNRPLDLIYVLVETFPVSSWRYDITGWSPVGQRLPSVLRDIFYNGDSVFVASNEGLYRADQYGNNFVADSMMQKDVLSYQETSDTEGTTRAYKFAKGPDVVQKSSVACVFELQELDGRRETILTVGYLGGDFMRRYKLRSGPKNTCVASVGQPPWKDGFVVELLRPNGAKLVEASDGAYVIFRFHRNTGKLAARGLWMDAPRRAAPVALVQGAETSGNSCGWNPTIRVPEASPAGAHIRMQVPIQITHPQCPTSFTAEMLACKGPSEVHHVSSHFKIITCAAQVEGVAREDK